jgi:hypothetical protein
MHFFLSPIHGNGRCIDRGGNENEWTMHKGGHWPVITSTRGCPDARTRTILQCKGSVYLAYNSIFSAYFFSQNNIFLSQQISQQCFSAGLSAQPNGVKVLMPTRSPLNLTSFPDQVMETDQCVRASTSSQAILFCLLPEEKKKTSPWSENDARDVVLGIIHRSSRTSSLSNKRPTKGMFSWETKNF